MAAYYNEWEPYCAEWLRNLIKEGLIADGDVDERSIADVEPADLHGYTQCHFFAGIGGWSYALRLAGWPDGRPVWTGSCPCQPFSVAGAGRGFGDERHLWPAWGRLVRELRPAIIFGEQASTIRGFRWYDAVSAEVEAIGYSIGAAVIPAYAAGANHLRNRLWFLADLNSQGLSEREAVSGELCKEAKRQSWLHVTGDADPAWNQIPAVSELCQADDGVPRRVGKIRAYGNAIVPQVAAEFIGAYMDATSLA